MRRARERAEKKAQSRTHTTIEPFFRLTTQFDSQGLPVFDKVAMTAAQLGFTRGMEKGFLETRRAEPEANYNFASFYYRGPEDFGGVMIESRDPAEAQREFQKFWDEVRYPQVGDTFNRDQLVDKGGEEAGMMFDLLNDGGLWPWPNAHAVLKKQGDLMLVTQQI
jgi:hypothetical protein